MAQGKRGRTAQHRFRSCGTVSTVSCSTRSAWPGDAAALKHLIGFLRDGGVIPREKKSVFHPTPAEDCAQAFGQYLLEVRALARSTIINYIPFIRSFLQDRFGPGRVTLSHLCARDVVRFVQRQASDRWMHLLGVGFFP